MSRILYKSQGTVKTMLKHFPLLFFTFLVTVFSSAGLEAEKSHSQDTENKKYFIFTPDNKYLAKVFQINNTTWVRIHETDEMSTVSQWKIPDFQPHTIQFSAGEPRKLLLAGKKRLLVYRLIEGKQKLAFIQPKLDGQEIIKASFDKESDEIVWATRNTVFKTGLKDKQKKEVASVPWDKGNIRAITGLSGDRYALSLEGSQLVQLHSKGKSHQLSEHQAPVASLLSPKEDELLSLDEKQELVIWDLEKKKAQTKMQLENPSVVGEVQGATLDDSGKNLFVLSEKGQSTTGRKYAIDELKRGVVNGVQQAISMTSTGNVYSAIDTFSTEVTKQELSRQDLTSQKTDDGGYKRLIESSTYKQKSNSLYDLAKIEADNENYQAALDLIKRIPLDDLEYRESRELRKEVLNDIEIRNSIAAAREQYNKGNLKSARIISENILDKNPSNADARKLVHKIDSRTSQQFWLTFLLLSLLLLLLAALGYFIWRYKTAGWQASSIGEGGSKEPRAAKTGKNETGQKEDFSRRAFVYKLDETRKMLNRAASLDQERRLKNTWMDITAKLNMIEKRAKLDDKLLADFMKQLSEIQEMINRFTLKEDKTSDFASDEGQSFGEKKDQQSNKKNHKERQPPPEDESKKKTTPNYYQVLGITKNATLEEIKKAYRRKMSEYHPDKHSASDFRWVKEEADRMTRIIQEAYTFLSDPQKRKEL